MAGFECSPQNEGFRSVLKITPRKLNMMKTSTLCWWRGLTYLQAQWKIMRLRIAGKKGPKRSSDVFRSARDHTWKWAVTNLAICYFYPYLGKWSNLTNIFQMGWNHQLVIDSRILVRRLMAFSSSSNRMRIKQHLSNKNRWLFKEFVGDEILPSYVGI